ncbi:cyclopropane-fatty-acyl-phospholipid synthase [Colletotrichum incanum]|nr:cyclopropane-fatty-acyl-phospholipid synthase [Colletotrichum incanum]
MDEIGPNFPFQATPEAVAPTLKIDHDYGVKITSAVTSATTPRMNERVKCPGLPVKHCLTSHKKEDRAKYRSRNKIPAEIFMRKYFDGDADFNGGVLDVLEYHHDRASFRFTSELLRYIFVDVASDVPFHSRSQDEDQVQDHYDRGDDFYAWFSSPRRVYTSGIISDVDSEESLEQLQGNKLAILCGKNSLEARRKRVGHRTLHRADVPESKTRIHCVDYRDIPRAKSDKITCLEMAEHVGMFNITNFLRQCADLLKDDDVMHLQIARADMSTPLACCIGFCESAGWGVKRWAGSVVTVQTKRRQANEAQAWIPLTFVTRPHRRWHRNWLANESDVTDAYGLRWFKLQLIRAPRSGNISSHRAAISSRQGSATCYQITLVKNINSAHRILRSLRAISALSAALEARKRAGRVLFPVGK